MKIENMKNEISSLVKQRKVVHFVDSATGEIVCLRTMKNVPFGIYHVFEYELKAHWERLMSLDVEFISADNDVISYHVSGLSGFLRECGYVSTFKRL